MAELGSLCSGPTLCGPALRFVMQSWVDAVWSSSHWSGLIGMVFLVSVGLVREYAGDIPGDGRTWLVVVRSYTVSSGPTVGDAELGLCGLVLFAVVRSYIV